MGAHRVVALVCTVAVLMQCCSCAVPTVTIVPSVFTYSGLTYSTYYVSGYFGSPPQLTNLLVDGGLDALLFFSTNCTQYGCPTQSAFLYDAEASSTYSSTGEPLDYTYAAGQITVTGEVGKDSGSFAGFQDPGQLMGYVENLSEPSYFPVVDQPLSGVWGFAYPTAQMGNLSMPQNLYLNNEDMMDFKYAIWLPMSIYENGVLNVGAVDDHFYEGEINYVPLLPSTWAGQDYPFFWTNKISSIKVDGVSNDYCESRDGCDFFVDLAGLPMDVSGGLPAVNISSDCSNMGSLPTYSFEIGGVDYTLTPEQYIIQYIGPEGTTMCESGINSGSRIYYPFTLGYTFIRNYYSVFDFANQQLGFAKAAQVN
mmetsp:Transcript_8315/g.34871  ORF Transcript_8315/g.34871 Transcript_8315/m.34871 type:complete len:367 (+) Transcript_8315:147-1247(+)